MTEFNSLEITGPFKHPIERLPEAEQRFPMLGNFVPLQVHSKDTFPMVLSDVQSIGNGAVSLSLGKPFGFMQMPEVTDRAYLSQLVEKIKISPSDSDPEKWVASFETAQPLTEQDEKLFSTGVRAIGLFAGIKLFRKDRERRMVKGS